MAINQVLDTRIILRNDSSAAWLQNSDQILLKGEIGIEFNPSVTDSNNVKTDYTVKIKIGDGISTWAELPYFNNTEYNEQVFATINGKLDLLGLAAAEVGASLVKAEDGSITWTKVTNSESPELIESVETLTQLILGTDEQVGLVDRVSTVETGIIAQIEKNEQQDTIINNLITELNNKVNKNDVYLKHEIDDMISSAIVDSDHLKRVLSSDDEIADFILNPARAARNTIYMVKNIGILNDSYSEYMRFDLDDGTIVFEQIGDTSIDLTPYAKFEFVNSELLKKVDKLVDENGESYRLISPTEAKKLESIEENAEANLIEAIRLENDTENLLIIDKIVTIPAATQEKLGLVKLSAEITTDDEGGLMVDSLNVSKLSTEGINLILDGGSATI